MAKEDWNPEFFAKAKNNILKQLKLAIKYDVNHHLSGIKTSDIIKAISDETLELGITHIEMRAHLLLDKISLQKRKDCFMGDFFENMKKGVNSKTKNITKAVLMKIQNQHSLEWRDANMKRRQKK